MKRVMIQADEETLERARQLARQQGVSLPQLVRDALERELAPVTGAKRQLQCVGVISTDGQARKRSYEPEPWRSLSTVGR
jgi:hypothetical protein